MVKRLAANFLILALLIPLTYSPADQTLNNGRYRFHVEVNSPGTYELAIDLTNAGFFMNETLNPFSVMITSSEGREVPRSLAFQEEEEVGWDLEHRNAVSFTHGEELCFAATGPDAYIKVMLDRPSLDEALGFTFSARGHFRAALRDASLMTVIAEREVAANESRWFFLRYDPAKLSKDRPYAFFLIPGPEVSCISHLKLVGGNLLIRWKAEDAGEYVIHLDTSERTAKISNITGGKRVEPTRIEGFQVIPNVQRRLNGKVKLEAKVEGNLSPVVRVQARLDYEGQYNWSNASKGILIDLTPSEDGTWIAEWDTLSTWDGRHILVLRAFDSQGKYAESKLLIWVENVVNGTKLNPNDDAFAFIVVGDNRPSGGAKQPEVYRQLLDSMLSVNPDLYFNVGDIVYSGELREYEDFVRVTSVIKAPLFIAEGNHENQIGRKGQENFMSYFGKLFYSFDYGNTHFIILNANVPGYRYGMSDEQIFWFDRDLSSTSADHVFVFIHQPIYPYAHGLEDKAALEKLRAVLRAHKGKVDILFQGHEHMYCEGVNDSIKFIITGGGGAELDNQYPPKYLFFHYVVVRVRGGEVSYEVVKPPVLELDEVPSVVDSPSLEIKGRAQPFATVKVNGKEVSPSKTGVFSSQVQLNPGENKISVIAEYEGGALSRTVRVRYMPHAKLQVPESLTSGSEIEVSVECMGRSAEGLLVLNNTSYPLRNGKAIVNLPEVSEPTTMSIAAIAKGCYPTQESIEISPRPLPASEYVIIFAFVILIAAIIIYTLRRRRTSIRSP